MSGGFFRGTSADQDTRFSNKQAKLLKSQKFSPVLDQLVDMTKVKMDVMKPWIATRATELLGFEDEVLINFIYGLLDGKGVDGKQIQIQLTGFMEKNTGKFMRELWGLLLSAQSNVSGVPQQFLDAKEEETRKKKEESDKITQEIKRRMDKDGRGPERERKSRFGDEADASKFTKDASGGIGSKFSEPRDSSMDRVDEESNRRQGSLPENRRSRASPPKNGSPTLRTIPSPTRSNDKKSMSRSRSISEERHRGRSLSVSSQSPKRSGSPRKRNMSPNKRSFSPRRRYRSPHRSRYRSPRDSRSPPRRKSSYLTQRSPSPYRGRSPVSRRRSPRRRSPSPVRRRSPSQRRRSPLVRRRSPSPVQHRSFSPVRRRSPSPVRRRTPSPVKRRSPSPVRRRTPSPVRRRTPSPVRRRTPSPVRRRTPSPVRHRSPSPVRRRSPSPVRERSPSPVRRRSPSPVRRRSPSPLRRRSPSPVRCRSPLKHRSPKKSRGSPSPSVSPIPRSLKRRKSPHKPHDLLSPRRSPVSRSSRHREPSPTRSPRYSCSSPQRKRGDVRKSPAKVSASVSHKMQISLRSPQRDAVSKNKTDKKSPIPSPEHSFNRSVSPTDMKVDGRIGRRSPNLSKSPVRQTRKEERMNHDREVMHNRITGSRKTSKGSPRDMKPEPYSPKRRNFSRSPELRNDKRRKRDLSPIDEHAQTHRLPSLPRADKVPEKERYERGSREHVNDRQSSEEMRNMDESYDTKQKGGTGNNYNERHHEPKQATLPKKRMDTDSEDSYKNDCVWGQRSKKPDKHKRDEEETSESDLDVELKKEAKRKRREEKRLRREERHKKREERHKRKLERRASKLKVKSSDKDTSDADDSESEQRRLEIELRERALESLRAKKGISH